eukprot:scaffold232564_cov33-Prasinocladus_malaysianus.AAC.1
MSQLAGSVRNWTSRTVDSHIQIIMHPPIRPSQYNFKILSHFNNVRGKASNHMRHGAYRFAY